jgi:hypothetical protein
MTQSSPAVPETGVDSGVASASVRPEPGSVDAAALIPDLRLAERIFQEDPDDHAAHLVGKLSGHAAGALEAKDRELAEARKHVRQLQDFNSRRELDILEIASQRDEAMAALREKEERVKALERALGISADALDGLGNASDAHVSPEVWRLHGCEYAVTSARSVLSSVQPVSGSREQRGNEEG